MMESEAWWVTKMVVALMAVVLVIIITVRMVDRHYSAVSCYAFSHAANRQVKFADYSFWTYECLTPAKDGKWISTELLRDVDTH